VLVSRIGQRGRAPLFAVLLGISGVRGAPANFAPPLAGPPSYRYCHSPDCAVIFMTGFESAPKAAEEAHPGIPSTGFFRAIVMALLVGAGFLRPRWPVAYISPLARL